MAQTIFATIAPMLSTNAATAGDCLLPYLVLSLVASAAASAATTTEAAVLLVMFDLLHMRHVDAA
eukprot:1016879-Amphidinium_carterae.1